MSDYLIIGQGLAGSLLAWTLIRRGQQVRVLDDGHRTASSRVAAGLINPLAGMRFNAHPRTADWLAAMHNTYAALARQLDQPAFVHTIPMQRLFRSPGQVRFFDRQHDNPAVADWLGARFGAGEADSGIRAPQGGFLQSHTGYVELPRLLDALRDWLHRQDAWRQVAVDLHTLRITPDGVELHGERAAHLVCCEGYRMRDNPWFDWLPLQPDRGVIQRLDGPHRLCRHIINGTHWLIPLADGGYRFGATHAHRRLEGPVSEEEHETLHLGLHGLLEDPAGVTVVEEAAGVRPATADRQSFQGTHPREPRLHLFNGFGARGTLSIPWHAEHMADWLLDGRPLPVETDIARHA